MAWAGRRPAPTVVGMKHVTYADKALLIDDEAADWLMEYARALGESHMTDSVTLRGIGMDGNEVTVLDLKLPSYQIVNLSAGIEWDNGLEVVAYVNNLFDENALLSFDRERGGRARLGFNIGTPRTIGITTRIKFGD